MWTAQIFGSTRFTALAVAGAQVPDIRLGVGVVPTYPRHPMALAIQALTVQSATGGRLDLGIGLSHQMVIEGMYGYSYEKPARHMREYLSALQPLLHGEGVNVEGETLTARGGINVPGATAPPVLVAALGSLMLKLTAEQADGTITWMTGVKTIGEHIAPTINAAAQAAGKPAPRVVVGLPFCVTDDVDGARGRAGETFAVYGMLPSYRAMLDREGIEGPPDLAVCGDESVIADAIRAVEDAGGTEVTAVPFGTPEEYERTVEVLAELARG
ncbi:MAG: TIGR03564 family F420-dependent LLM class oxidoreductase [Acidimicrobiia bacterium]